MKVLLTGANGFVGSHILDALRAKGQAVRLLLRQSADTGLIRDHLSGVEITHGSLADPAAIRKALSDCTHVIHCAGKTKALNAAEYFEVNQGGTRNLVLAMNEHADALRRLVFISSLAASRPGTRADPAREDDAPAPVTVYGRSKLAAEREVQKACRTPFTVLRPSAVYGPRDRDMLVIAQCLRAPLRPRFGAERQELSLIYAQDLAAATVHCLEHEKAAGKTYNVAAPEVVLSGELTRQMAVQMQKRPLTIPLPASGMWLLCAAGEIISRVTRRPHILSRGKYPELRALGWVCDTSRLARDTGFIAPTRLEAGLAATLAWYRKEGWL